MTDYIIGGEILTKKKLVTIDGSMVTTETGIPLALNIVLPNVKAAGADVRLAELDGTPIAREIECVDVPSTDAVMLHYLFDTTAGENSQFYIYWGNASLNEPAADSAYGSEAVWDSNFKIVWHMNNDPNGDVADSIIDSTSNANHGTPYGSMTTADLVDTEYGKGIDFDGAGDYIKIALSTMDLTDVTISVRLNISMSAATQQRIFDFATTNYTANILAVLLTDSDAAYGSIPANKHAMFDWTTPNNINGVWASDGVYVTTTLQVDDTVVDLRVEGSSVASGSITRNDKTLIDEFSIASSILGDYYTDGIYSEVRISNTPRTDNWIGTEHKNLNNPTASGTDSFYLSRYDDSQTYTVKSDSGGTKSTFLRRTPITRNHTGALTDYQQSYTIPYHVLMNTDFSDFRFNTQADGNGDYLPYWIESQTNSDTADVWVKSDYASGDDIIYMFYGNSGLTSESSISNIALDDIHYTAENNILPTAYIPTWTLDGIAGTVSNGILSQNDDSGSTGATYRLDDSNISGNVVSTMKMKFVSGNPYAAVQFGTTSYSWYIDLSATAITNAYRTEDTAAVDGDAWATYDFILVGSTMSIYRDSIFIMDTENTHTSSNFIVFGPYGNAQTGQLDSKFIFMRKYTATEPTYTIEITDAPNKFSAVSDSDGNVSIFERRKPVKLTHSGALTDYQYYETFNYEPAMLDNFDDIRFVTQSGEHISYWIETKTDGVSAKVWFKNDYVDGDTYIWMYYGSEGLSNGSSGTDTMIVADSFNDGIIDTSIWSLSGSPTETGGNLVLNSALEHVDADESVNYQLVLDTITTIRVNIDTSPVNDPRLIVTDDLTETQISAGDNGFAFLLGPTSYTQTGDGAARTEVARGSPPTGWFNVNMIWTSGQVVFDRDGTEFTHTTNIPSDSTTGMYLKLLNYFDAETTLIDYIYIRKYTVIEPTVTVGAEQHSRTGNIMIL